MKTNKMTITQKHIIKLAGSNGWNDGICGTAKTLGYIADKSIEAKIKAEYDSAYAAGAAQRARMQKM